MSSILKATILFLLIGLTLTGAGVGWLSILWPTGIVRAATALDAVNVSGESGCDPCEWTHTAPAAGSDSIIVVVVTHEPNSGQTIEGIAYSGQPLIEARTDTNPGSSETSIWYRTVPAPGPNTVSVDFSAPSSRSAFVSYTFTGVDQANPIEISAGATGTGSPATVDVSNTSTYAWIVDGVHAKANLNMASKAGRTERMNNASGPFSAGSSTLQGASTPATYTLDWSFGGNKNWAISAVSLTPINTVEYSETSTDSTSISESIAVALGFSRSDTASLGTSVATALGFTRSDNASVAASMTLGYPRSVAAGVSESIAVALGFSRSDTASLSGYARSAIGKGFGDQAKLRESAALGYPQSERASLGESVAIALGFVPTDASSLGDSIKAALGFARSDASTLRASAGLGYPRSERASLGESIALVLGFVPTDTSSLGDSIKAALGFDRSDASTLRASAGLGYVRSDTASLSDSIATSLGFRPADTASLGGYIRSALGKGVVDGINLLGLGSAALGYPRSETASIEESIATALAPSRMETSNVGVLMTASLGSIRMDGASMAEFVSFVVQTAEADLEVTKGGIYSESVTAGDTLTYILTVMNHGPTSANDVVLTETLSDNVVFESATASDGTCTEESGTVKCELGNILNEGIIIVTVNVTPLPAAGSNITSTASVTSAVPDPTLENNSVIESLKISAVPQADLWVTNNDDADPVHVGSALAYSLTVYNKGPLDATEVVLTDTPPANVTLSSAAASQGACGEASEVLTCYLGTIEPGAKATVTVIFTPTAAAGGTTITNTANVTSGIDDLDESNNDASQITSVTSKADLAVVKLDPNNGVITGKQLTYNIIVTNKGPSKATEVVVTDTLPAEVAFISATPSQGSCSEASGTVTCDVGSIDSGAVVTIPILVTVQLVVSTGQTKSITNWVIVQGGGFDPFESNNAAVAFTKVYHDDDGDGIGDDVEASAPNGGDGDGDGVPDKDQVNVTSFKNAVDEEYATLKSAPGTKLIEVEPIKDKPDPENAPATAFPMGLFRFEVEGVPTAAATTVEIFFPEGTIIVSYWKYGPTGDNPAPHWYEFIYDGTTGATIDGNKVTLHFVDGQRGDDDLTANGEIVDDGAPVLASAD